jgi:hypothetical protein
MKESSWKDCMDSNSAVRITPDTARAKSLAETADERIKVSPDINEKNCNFVFEDYYTSIMELLQALVILNGYKISNHVCLGYYIRDVLKRGELYVLFDDIRYKRNSLTYYGKRMDFDTAMQAIRKCRKLIADIKGLIEK